MRRLTPHKIDDAQYYEFIWSDEVASGRGHFDGVRQRALAQKVRPGNKVLDLGAGVWGTAQYIAQELHISNVTLVAYDQSYTAREIVARMCPSLLYLLGPVERTSFEDGEFDCVIAGEVIEHMEEPAGFVQEMARICRVGGWMTLTTVDTTCEQAVAHGPYPEHVFEFTPQDLIGFFLPYGKTEYSIVGNYHFILCHRSG